MDRRFEKATPAHFFFFDRPKSPYGFSRRRLNGEQENRSLSWPDSAGDKDGLLCLLPPSFAVRRYDASFSWSPTFDPRRP